MNFLDDGTAEEIYEHISLTIDGRFFFCSINVFLLLNETSLPSSSKQPINRGDVSLQKPLG